MDEVKAKPTAFEKVEGPVKVDSPYLYAGHAIAMKGGYDRKIEYMLMAGSVDDLKAVAQEFGLFTIDMEQCRHVVMGPRQKTKKLTR
jgi:hypothetical protein